MNIVCVWMFFLLITEWCLGWGRGCSVFNVCVCLEGNKGCNNYIMCNCNKEDV